MKKICIGIVLILITAAFTVSGATEEDPLEVDLWADGGSPETAFDAGDINVWDDGTELHIEYYITEEGDLGEPWEMTITHVHIGDDIEEDFPLTKKGNPKVGKFDYQMDFDDPVTSYEVIIPYDGEELIAVHGEIQTVCGYEPGLYDPVYFEASLPDQVTFSVTYPVSGGPAYFPNTYISGLEGGDINIYSWCVDTDNGIAAHPTTYTANIYSSYETLPSEIVEYPENLDKVNWILNQGYVGQTSPGGYGTYTYGDVQKAIWELIEDNPMGGGLAPWRQCRVDEIVSAAYANGEGFEPECGDIIGIILAPVNGAQVLIAQAILGTLYAPCYEAPIYCDETFWAGKLGENEFKGDSWAMYFDYNYGGTEPVVREKPNRIIPMIFARIIEILLNLRAA